MSRTYLWVVMVPWINSRGDRVPNAMAPYTITPVVGVVRHCTVKTGLRRSPRGLHTRTRFSSLPKLNMDSSLKTTQFSPFGSHSITSSATPFQTKGTVLHAEIVEIEVVSPSIVPSGNFAELKSHCHLYGAQGQRQAYLLPMPR
ncbi:hypothetical protein TNCV_4570081 [Trichonephila clavipes]|nr:hypothetical protein TNCV_4570081 [Trichonephila clavipes]